MKKIYAILIIIVILWALSSPVLAFPIFQEGEAETAEVPIVMYHLVTKNAKYHGKYGISPNALEDDLRFLKENGYETVVMSDIIRFVENGRRLPQKPVILTFDDGCGSDYHYVYPLLEKYGMRAVISIVGKLADDYTNDGGKGKKPHLEWGQIKEMHDSGCVEVQNHSYNLHGSSGSGKRSGESTEAYEKRLNEDIIKAQSAIRDNVGVTPTTFAYPLGVISKDSKAILRELGFKATLSCAEGSNTITEDDPDCLFGLKRNLRSSGRSAEEMLKKLEKVGDTISAPKA